MTARAAHRICVRPYEDAEQDDKADLSSRAKAPRATGQNSVADIHVQATVNRVHMHRLQMPDRHVVAGLDSHVF